MMDATDFLEHIVSCYSPSRREEKVSGTIVDLMSDIGFDARVDEAGNAVGECGSGEKTLLLAGHIDTVRGEIPVRKEGDLLYGRGSVDAKGPFAAMVMAAARHLDSDNLKIIVAGCVEEESATSKGARALIKTIKPDYIIVGEPSGWSNITIGYKGRLLVDYHLTKPKKHSAGREPSTPEDAFSFWQQAREFAEGFGSESVFNSLQPSIRRIKMKDDGLAESLRMRLGFRIPPGFDIDMLEEHLDKMKGSATLKFSGREAAYVAEKNNALIRAFLSAIREKGGKPKFKKKSGTADMNVFGAAFDVPICTYGPGDSSLDHTPDEHISIAEYEKAINVLEEVIGRLK